MYDYVDFILQFMFWICLLLLYLIPFCLYLMFYSWLQLYTLTSFFSWRLGESYNEPLTLILPYLSFINFSAWSPCCPFLSFVVLKQSWVIVSFPFTSFLFPLTISYCSSSSLLNIRIVICLILRTPTASWNLSSVFSSGSSSRKPPILLYTSSLSLQKALPYIHLDKWK